MRGKLINPFLACIAQLDTELTAADPDGAGPLTSGYDDVFRETVLVPQDDEQTGTDARVEKPEILLPAQVEMDAFEALQQFAAGTSSNFQMRLVFHFIDLEREGMVDPNTGEALIRANDRLVSIHDMCGNLVQSIRTPPGLYATEVQPRAFGIGKARNLLLVTFEDRELATRA